MFGSIGKALGAVFPVPALGTALGMGESALAYKGQKDANESNERIAKENRAFQERMANTAMDYQTETIQKAHDYQTEMSNTAYQRSMSDMKEAGLNPILAYQQGGASTPIGQTAPGHTAAGSVATMQNPFGGMGGSPVQNVSTAAQAAQRTADTRRTVMDEKRLKQEIAVLAQKEGLTNSQIHKTQTELDKLRKEIIKLQSETEGIDAENVQRKVVAEFIESAEFAAIARYIGVKPETFRGFVNLLRPKKGKR